MVYNYLFPVQQIFIFSINYILMIILFFISLLKWNKYFFCYNIYNMRWKSDTINFKNSIKYIVFKIYLYDNKFISWLKNIGIF